MAIEKVRMMGRTRRSCRMKGTPNGDASESRKENELTLSLKHAKTPRKAERKFECLEPPRAPVSPPSASDARTTLRTTPTAPGAGTALEGAARQGTTEEDRTRTEPLARAASLRLASTTASWEQTPLTRVDLEQLRL